MGETAVLEINPLSQQLNLSFSLEELSLLTGALDIEDVYDLGGSSKAGKIHALVQHIQRTNQIPDLLQALQQARPHVDWAAFVPEDAAHFPLHQFPYPRNPLFTGRKAILDELAQHLTTTAKGAVPLIAITGLGGVGKTQLVLETCYRHLHDYDLIYWLYADEAATLGGNLAELAYRLNLAPRSLIDQNLVRQRLMAWLQMTSHRWLLIFDNVDTLQPDDLLPYLPKTGNGRCLLTSRNPNWSRLAQPIPLDVFSEEEAYEFLREHQRLSHSSRMTQSRPAKQLADLLGHLPLALEHARAYCEETGTTLAEYAKLFETERQALWAQATPPADYAQRTITTTWELAFKQSQQTPGAADLLNLCAFLAPDDIPLSLFTTEAFDEDTAALLPESFHQLLSSKLKLNRAIAALRQYSLLTRQSNTISIHPLIQTVTRDRMPIKISFIWLEFVTHHLASNFLYNESALDTWKLSSQISSHVIAVADYAYAQEIALFIVANLYNRLGRYWYTQGNYHLAKSHLERAIAIYKHEPEANGEQLAFSLSNLGSVLTSLEDYEAAQVAFEHSLRIRKQSLGPSHPYTGSSLNDLGALLQATGNYKKAKIYFEHALKIYEQTFGEDHLNTAAILNNLGELLGQMGDYAHAKSLLKRALKITKNNFDTNHHFVGNCFNRLGELLYASSDYTIAKSYLERALDIHQKALGTMHPVFARDLLSLGALLQDLGDYVKAQKMIKQALSIQEATYGYEHPRTNAVRDKLKVLLTQTEYRTL